MDVALVPCDELVAGQQRECFDLRLCDQDSIEWVIVNRRQEIHGSGVDPGDGEFVVFVLQERPVQNAWINVEVLASQPALNRDFPQRRCAEEERVL